MGMPVYNSVAPSYEYWAFLNGIGSPLNPISQLSASLITPFPVFNTQREVFLSMPCQAGTFAKFTGAWEIWASHTDKTMYARLAINGQSLSGDAMFDAFTTSYFAEQYLIHGDITSNFRPSFDTCVFPRWLMMRHAHHAIDLVFKEARVRYFDWDENELEA